MIDDPSIYCASPLGFSDAGRMFLNSFIRPAFEKAGLEMIDPWKLTPQADVDAVLAMPYGQQRRHAWTLLSETIGENNTGGILRAHGLFAVLDGTDVDSGTAAEIGFAAGCGMPIAGYRGDFRLAADNEGVTVNLQVEHFIRRSGSFLGEQRGRIVTKLEDVVPVLRELRARCLAANTTMKGSSHG